MPHFSAILLPSPVGHHYYTSFYLLAFLLNQALLLWEGHRRGYPLRPWLLLTTGGTLAFILGTKLIAVPLADWPALWQHGEWPVTTARSVLGGALGGTLAVLVLRRWLGFSAHVFDAFCIPMCAAYALQCVGCLLTGCCFGHVAPAGWGVHYAPDTLPYLVQLQRGLIEPGAAQSLAVLPTQLFTALLSVGVAAVLWLNRHRAWPGGSWRLLHIGLLLAGRFVIEFARDPAGEQVGTATLTWAGITLKQVQWWLLPLVVALGVWWLRRTRAARGRTLAPETAPTSEPLRNLLGVAGLLAATAFIGPGALTLPELLVIKTALTVVLGLEVGALLWRRAARPHLAALPLGLASVLLLFSNQAPAPTDSAAVRRYLTLGLGASQGTYDENIVESGGCNGTSSRTAFYHRYQLRGGTAEYTVENPKSLFRAVGLGVWVGSERIGYQTLSPTGPFLTTGEQGHLRRNLWSINPSVEFRSRNDGDPWEFGLRTGLHLGNLTHTARQLRRDADSTNTLRHLLPEVMIWTGVRKTLFAQGDFGVADLALGNYTYRLGMGSGLGTTTSHVLGGVAFSRHHPSWAMGFISAHLQLGRTGIVLSPYGATDFGRHHQLSGRLLYRIPLHGANR